MNHNRYRKKNTTLEPNDALLGVVQPLESQETILQEAERIINGNRNHDYGPAEDSFYRIATLWNAYLKLLHPELEDAGLETDLIGVDTVAELMILLKLARGIEGPKRDNVVDMAGYAALLGRLQGLGL